MRWSREAPASRYAPATSGSATFKPLTGGQITAGSKQVTLGTDAINASDAPRLLICPLPRRPSQRTAERERRGGER